MGVEDLDEAQGMDREMVERYLDRKGWCNTLNPDVRLLKPECAHVSFAMGLGAAVERIAAIEGATVQSLLRAVNPRMRKGTPSEAARAAHPTWLVRSISSGEIEMYRIHDGAWFASTDPLYPEEMGLGLYREFWPCDGHGNKVRWPEKDGVML